MTNSKLCLACLSSEETFTFILFKNVSAQEYGFCTSVEVHENDDLPKTLCRPCHEMLTKFSDFKRMCMHSQKSLLDLKCMDIKVEIEVPSSAYKNGPEPEKGVVKEEEFGDKFNDDLYEDEISGTDGIYQKKKCNKRNIKLIKFKRKRNYKQVGPKKHFNYSCDLCNKKFVYIERFEAHKLEHEGKVVPIHCLPCNKTFRSWNALKRHNTNEHTVVSLESLKCTVCGKILKSQESLKAHAKLHESDLPRIHVCDVCGKDFRTKSALKSHLETHKENRERDYTCEHCGQKFFSNAVLTNHISRGHTSRRYICHECGYPFTQKCNLIKHLLIHEGKKLYTCDICQKSYRTQSTLKEHKRIHSGERPYQCTYCPKSFLSKRRLNDHNLTHTGKRPHKCSVCNLSFSQRGTLTRHMKVHCRSTISR